MTTMNVHWSAFHRDFTENEVHEYVPREGGVYLLWVRMKSRKWRCFFAGAADNLEERLLQHLSPKEENRCIAEQVSDYVCGFEYARVDGPRERQGVLKFLYDRYLPDCCAEDPGGTPLKVNPP